MSNSNAPKIGEISEVKMYNPDTGEENPIEKIDFKGITDIFEHDDIVERRGDGWVVRGFTADVDFRNKKYEVTVAGNQVMGYVKVDDVADYDEGRELQRIMRNEFRESFGFRY